MFDDPDEGYRVLNSDLRQEVIDNQCITVTVNLKCDLFFKAAVFVQIQERLEQLFSGSIAKNYK